MEDIKVVHRKLGRHKAWGRAIFDKRTIEIDERIKGIDHLDTVIHEILHLQNDYIVEDKILQNATELATILWNLGYRRTLEK